MAGGCDARGAVHVGADVAFRGQDWDACAQAEADLDRSGSQGLRGLRRGSQRARRGPEGDEEGVVLGVDLDSPMPSKRVAEGAVVVGQDIGICLGAEAVEQLRRALEIGTQESDRPCREIACHARIMHALGRCD